MSLHQDEREAQPALASSDLELAELRKKLEIVEKSRARFASQAHRLKADLDAVRAQVAWFHRQLFGQKAERVSTADLEAAFLQYMAEQEARARGEVPDSNDSIEVELTSIQLLMDFGVLLTQDGRATRSNNDEAVGPEATPPPVDSDAASESPPPAPPKKKKKGHGRKRIPPTLREETIVIEPDEVPEGSRQVGAEVSYRVGMRRPELVRFAVVRPKYEIEAEDRATTRSIIAEPPHEMIPRGLFAPSGLAHIIASRHDRSVPYNRLGRFFSDSGYQIPVSTLSGVAIRATPLVEDLLDTMKAHAQKVAPYLAIDATGVLLQQPKRCVRGHVWLRYIEDVCVLVSFTYCSGKCSGGARVAENSTLNARSEAGLSPVFGGSNRSFG